jgi:O-antigen/teichoic acid export membrane protein
MSIKQKAISSVKWNGISIGSVTSFQFVTLAVLSHLLSPADFGLMGMVMIIIGFSQIFSDMGISKAIIYRQDATKDELSSLYWLNIGAGIVTFFLVCIACPFITDFYHEPRLSNMIYLSSLTFLVTPFGQQFQILMQKELKFDKLAKVRIISSFVKSVSSIVLAILGVGVFSIIWGQLVGTIIEVLLLSSFGWKNWRPRLHFSIPDLRGYLSFGIYQMGERVINYFNSNLDYLIIGAMLGAKALGYYTLAYNLILRPIQLINSLITKVAFPVFSRVQEDTQKLKNGYLKILQLLSTVNFPVMVGLAIVAPVAVPVIFGEKWLPSIILVQVLTIVGLLRSIGSPIGSILLARGRADLGFKWNLALMILQVPGLYFGAKLGGILGVAVAYAILMVLYTLFSYFILIRKMFGPCVREYIGSMWPLLWISGVMGLALLGINNFVSDISPRVSLVIQVISGIVIYGTLMNFIKKNIVQEIKEMVLGEKNRQR